jgi:hypothetical protein
MAIVRHLALRHLERVAPHTDAECTYAIIADPDGKTYLQIDTYGSGARQIKGKISQSIRFTPDAIAELRLILAKIE